MRVTTELLGRLRSLDDLIELAAALGYRPSACEINPLAQQRLGLHGVLRAALLARRDTLTIYGAVTRDASRTTVGTMCARLARATLGEHPLLLALDPAARSLAVATPVPGEQATPRVLCLRLDPPSRAGAEILDAAGSRDGEPAAALAVRLADALADEGLTTRFFREFARAHQAAALTLERVPRATMQERRDLALVILTRVLFLYFVQAKGWLAGRRDFLPSLLDTALGRGHPFHTRYFEPLCFGALATPAARRTAAARALGDIPFLNGGLFERHPTERRFPGAMLPNDTWRSLFDDFFERFHFTCREGPEADAVDPVMLGRVFEELMGTQRRKAAGAYYTPPALLREVVAQALAAALEHQPPGRITTLTVLDPAVGSGAFLLETLRQLERRRCELFPDEPPARIRRTIIRDCLFGVDSDPMAVRLAELRLWLALVTDEEASWRDVLPLPNLDRNLRQGDSLISPLDLAGATRPEGASVRFAKVAERRAAYFSATGTEKAALARQIRAQERSLALSCTDAAIATLSARLSDAAATSSRDLFGARGQRSAGLARKVAEWRRSRRELLRVRARLLLDDALPFFAYDVHYGDVLERGGFDVVMGNPPWIRGERVPKAQRELLERRYASWRVSTRGGFAHIPDLSVAFIERSLELVRPGGVMALLLPAKVLRAGYGGPIRLHLRRNTTVLALHDLAHSTRHGFAATVFPLMAIVRRKNARGEERCAVVMQTSGGTVIEGTARQDDLSLDSAPSGAPWLVLPSRTVAAVREALRAGPSLSSRFRPRLGIKTGCNDAFLRPHERAAELPAPHRLAAIRGADIAPFRIRPGSVILAAIGPDGAPLPSAGDDVSAHLEPYAKKLERRTDSRGCPAWTLFRTDLARRGWFVLWRDIAPVLMAACLERDQGSEPVPLNTCYGVSVPDAHAAAWLVALLNSAALRVVAAVLADRASSGAYRFNAAAVGALPTPLHTATDEVQALAAIGKAATRGEPWDQNELDSLSYRALGLRTPVAAALRELAAALCRDPGRHS